MQISTYMHARTYLLSPSPCLLQVLFLRPYAADDLAMLGRRPTKPAATNPAAWGRMRAPRDAHALQPHPDARPMLGALRRVCTCVVGLASFLTATLGKGARVLLRGAAAAAGHDKGHRDIGLEMMCFASVCIIFLSLCQLSISLASGPLWSSVQIEPW